MPWKLVIKTLYQNLEKMGETREVNETTKIVVKNAMVVDFLK